jgi:3-phenylpropionate/trans-cinnamate dioxygenase ferredoxin reductase component
VQTSDGELIEGDIVLVAIGCVPNVEWLQGSGLDLTDGVGCDSACQAAPHVWAAGDVARWHHPGLRQSLRLEHRMNASEQGAIVAANITGETRRFAPVPFFWTDHYATKVQLAGVIPAGAVERSELEADDSFVRTFWSEDRLVGVVGWNAAKAMMPFRQTLDLSEPAIA